MNDRTILVWFRNDLRVHDNEILIEAVKKARHILPVYCFDPRYFSETPYQTLRTGIHRAKFLLESVEDLRDSLRKLGGDLMILVGKPEEVLPELVGRYQISEVYHHREVAALETEISSYVEEALWKQQINLKHFIGHTLYHKEDLPFPIKDIPDSFSTFKKKVDRDSAVRPSVLIPGNISLPEGFVTGELPSLDELVFSSTNSENYQFRYKGGESAGLLKMKQLFLEQETSVGTKSKKTLLQMAEMTGRLSPWISLGCLSAREVYWELKKNEYQADPSMVSNLILGLLRRDYFRFMFKKHGNELIVHKLLTATVPELNDLQKYSFDSWKKAGTGIAFVDACLTELRSTGYLNEKGRGVVARYLIHDLQVPWTYGAAFFEEMLIDYSPASNWGNWASLAGEGFDKKERRDVDILKEALSLDPKGDYTRCWLGGTADRALTHLH